jgi:hypothetical protein
LSFPPSLFLSSHRFERFVIPWLGSHQNEERTHFVPYKYAYRALPPSLAYMALRALQEDMLASRVTYSTSTVTIQRRTHMHPFRPFRCRSSRTARRSVQVLYEYSTSTCHWTRWTGRLLRSASGRSCTRHLKLLETICMLNRCYCVLPKTTPLCTSIPLLYEFVLMYGYCVISLSDIVLATVVSGTRIVVCICRHHTAHNPPAREASTSRSALNSCPSCPQGGHRYRTTRSLRKELLL